MKYAHHSFVYQCYCALSLLLHTILYSVGNSYTTIAAKGTVAIMW